MSVYVYDVITMQLLCGKSSSKLFVQRSVLYSENMQNAISKGRRSLMFMIFDIGDLYITRVTSVKAIRTGLDAQ